MSGLNQRFAKPSYGVMPYRGFESPPIRQHPFVARHRTTRRARRAGRIGIDGAGFDARRERSFFLGGASMPDSDRFAARPRAAIQIFLWCGNEELTPTIWLMYKRIQA